MAEASRTRLGKQDRTAGNSFRWTQSRDIHHWARGWEFQKWPLWTPNDSCGGCALWQSLPGPSFASKLARRGTPSAGRKAVTFIIGRGEWEFQKRPLRTPNDSCGGCALWQSLPGPSFASKLARRGTPSAGRKAVTFIIGRGEWEFQKRPLRTPNDSCGGCALWQSLPGPSFASKLARRVLEGSAARLCWITYFSFRRSRPFWRRLGGCRL